MGGETQAGNPENGDGPPSPPSGSGGGPVGRHLERVWLAVGEPDVVEVLGALVVAEHDLPIRAGWPA